MLGVWQWIGRLLLWMLCAGAWKPWEHQRLHGCKFILQRVAQQSVWNNTKYRRKQPSLGKISWGLQVLVLAVLLLLWTDLPSTSWKDHKYFSFESLAQSWLWDNNLAKFLPPWVLTSAGSLDLCLRGDFCGWGSGHARIQGFRYARCASGLGVHVTWAWQRKPHGLDYAKWVCEPLL